LKGLEEKRAGEKWWKVGRREGGGQEQRVLLPHTQLSKTLSRSTQNPSSHTLDHRRLCHRFSPSKPFSSPSAFVSPFPRPRASLYRLSTPHTPSLLICSTLPPLLPFSYISSLLRMRLNESTTLVSSRVVLRPYRKWHVQRYSEWLDSETLREATASERLTLEEEYEMQRAFSFSSTCPSPASSHPLWRNKY
jgi:hypothetical protein